MTIKELSYSGMSKSPPGIANYLIQKHKDAHSHYSLPGLVGGIRVDIGSFGISLAMSNRQRIFKTSLLLFKKNYLLFITGSNSIIVFKRQMIKWNAIKIKGKPFPIQMNKIRLTPTLSLFQSFGINSGGVKAFFLLMKKLDKSNIQISMKKVLALGAVVVNKEYIPYAMFKNIDKMPTITANDKEEEVKLEPIDEPKSISLIPYRPPVELYMPKKVTTKIVFKSGQPKDLKIAVNTQLTNDLKKAGLKDDEFNPISEKAKDSINAWASSATSEISQQLQIAAANLAGIGPKEITKSFVQKYCIIKDGKLVSKISTGFAKSHAEVAPVIVSAVYKSTQDWLKTKNITYLRLYRGMKLGLNLKAWIIEKRIRLNPLSSFSTVLRTAEDFGKYILGCIVPAKRIFSCPETGHGCKNEFEFIIFGGVVKTWLIDLHKLSLRLSSLDNEYRTLRDLKLNLNNYSMQHKSFDAKDKARLEKLKSFHTSSKDFDVIATAELLFMSKMKKEQFELAAISNDDSIIDADEGDNANWIKKGLDTGSLPLIGTEAFQKRLIQKKVTFEEEMKVPAYNNKGIKSVAVLQLLMKIATTMDTGVPKKDVPTFAKTNKSLCHLDVVAGIKERKNKSDKIWIFGQTEKTGHQTVFHSLLTDRNNKILANNYAGAGNNPANFDPTKGYKTPAGEYVPILAIVSVSEFFKKLFRVAP